MAAVPDRIFTVCARMAGALAIFLAAANSASAFELITQKEAALPAAPVLSLDLRGSPTRRPAVIVVSPPPAAAQLSSPLDLKLQFRAFGGATIDPSTVVITYLKQPAIDLTQRLTPFITAQGVDIRQAQVPPGKHQFWIELKDNEGRIGGGAFSFQVGQ